MSPPQGREKPAHGAPGGGSYRQRPRPGGGGRGGARGGRIPPMRYLVTARVKPGKEAALLQAIEDGTLGQGSVAGSEYLDDMAQARWTGGDVRWVEVCFCWEPLDEERP